MRCIRHRESGEELLAAARWCDSFGSKLRGFTFRRALAPGEGLVLVERGDSRLATSIHMFFVFCDLGVLWVNEAGEVVDSVVARPWRPSYAPRRPARYVIEAEPALVQRIAVGEHIDFETV
jgi:uncharacterized membrane protein (UPF0127 family)